MSRGAIVSRRMVTPVTGIMTLVVCIQRGEAPEPIGSYQLCFDSVQGNGGLFPVNQTECKGNHLVRPYGRITGIDTVKKAFPVFIPERFECFSCGLSRYRCFYSH